MTPGDGAKGRPFGARAIFPDAMENSLLERFFAGSAGYFVEVGANDPLIDSKIWSLEQKGGTVLLVEPQPEHADRLRAIRKFIIGIARYDRRGSVFSFSCMLLLKKWAHARGC